MSFWKSAMVRERGSFMGLNIIEGSATEYTEDTEKAQAPGQFHVAVIAAQWDKNPHPNPLPAYRERGQEGRCDCVQRVGPAVRDNVRHSRTYEGMVAGKEILGRL